jgi:hypothetical protein
MTLHLARISVITIALALVAGLGILLARPQAPMVITLVVPAAQAQTTVVQPTYVRPYWGGPCNTRVCWH